ncbi:GMC oxidoreductase-domain-containing protein [Phellopilus nigrolimitatus]|nr:GMC oxidoreductase-domain-containing protein [Phellopilus nigrolimitatus]
MEHIREKWPSIEFMMYSPAPKLPDPSKKYLSLGPAHVVSNTFCNRPAAFAEPYDLATMVETIEFVRRLVKEEPLKSLLSGVELNPGEEYKTDEKIAEYLRLNIGPTFHTIGSASMLPLEDDGVVDANLKVHKSTNIRVADTSIVPLHVGAHIQALAYAIGEKAADIIKTTC